MKLEVDGGYRWVEWSSSWTSTEDAPPKPGEVRLIDGSLCRAGEYSYDIFSVYWFWNRVQYHIPWYPLTEDEVRAATRPLMPSVVRKAAWGKE